MYTLVADLLLHWLQDQFAKCHIIRNLVAVNRRWCDMSARATASTTKVRIMLSDCAYVSSSRSKTKVCCRAAETYQCRTYQCSPIPQLCPV